MKDPHTIIIRPHITEKAQALSYGDPFAEESTIQRSYTFIVNKTSNKIEIKQAIEAIYNAGKKEKELEVEVEKVRTINVPGKLRRVGQRSQGKTTGFKKAIVTLKIGQMLEDYGV